MAPGNIDGSSRTPKPEDPDLWRLPDVLDVRIAWRRLDPPKLVTLQGKDEYWHEALEFELHLSEPLVSRALYPVLWVGDERLSVVTGRSDRVICFYARDAARFAADAPIELAWSSTASPRKQTGYRYRPQPRA
jgi:hypothetical protein